MGIADTVPGVSGGTVALILGHYERLVTGISHIDSHLARLLFQRRWRDAVNHGDLRFLMVLALGMAFGILSLASAMHWLLDHRLAETFSLFFGVILASSYLVAKQIKRWTAGGALLAFVTASFVYVLAQANSLTGSEHGAYLFVAAMIAICAMILPGISGAFVLLLLGTYYPVTSLVKELASGNANSEILSRIALFVLGCLVGLLLFSRLLKYLLRQHATLTYCALLGLMLGSLRKLWPLQKPTAETVGEKFSLRKWELVPPDQWSGSLVTLLLIALGGTAIVLALDAWGSRLQSGKQDVEA